MVTVESGEKFTVAVRGFDDVEDISAVPTRFTPACDDGDSDDCGGGERSTEVLHGVCPPR
jgi:hypothetical protein